MLASRGAQFWCQLLRGSKTAQSAEPEAWPEGVPGDGRIPNIVIIAGPTASGKSTFMAMLAAGRLPIPIATKLPATASNWLQTSGRKVFARPAARGRGDDRPSVQDGVALHYDMMRPYARGFEGFGADPALKLLTRAEAITVVTLRACGPELARRISNRARPASRITRRLSRHDRELVALYALPGWLDEQYAEWDRFIQSAFGERLRAVVEITSNNGPTGFSLAGTPKPPCPLPVSYEQESAPCAGALTDSDNDEQ